MEVRTLSLVQPVPDTDDLWRGDARRQRAHWRAGHAAGAPHSHEDPAMPWSGSRSSTGPPADSPSRPARRSPGGGAVTAVGAGPAPSVIAERLRESLSAGDFTTLGELYADDALLDASLAGDRFRGAGPERATELLGSRANWPGASDRVVAAAASRRASRVWFERVSDGGTAVRQRHYLRLRDGRIERHWVYTAPPRTPPPARGRWRRSCSIRDSSRGLGEVVEHEPLVSHRAGRATRSSASCSPTAAGWSPSGSCPAPTGSTATRRTRDARRCCSPPACSTGCRDAIDHAIVAAERDGEAWWVVMRDVSATLLPDDKRLSREETGASLRP